MFNVDDILVSRSSYGCCIVTFYKVKKVTKSNVWLQEMENKVVSDDGYGQAGYVVPDSKETTDKPIMRKIQHSTYCSEPYDYVKVSDHNYAVSWDGKQVSFNYYD